MFYVPIDGIADSTLEFLGYQLVREDAEFKLYKDFFGEEYVVQKSNPRLKVDDINEVRVLQAASTAKTKATYSFTIK